MTEMIYIAFQDSKLLGYAFEIDIFFEFLKGFLSQNPAMKVEIERLPLEKCKIDYQTLYPMDEIIEFTKNVFLTSKQSKFWEEYFDECRMNVWGKITQSGEGLHHLNKDLCDLKSFLNYLGPDMVRNIVYSESIDMINEKYAMYMDYAQKIEDK